MCDIHVLPNLTRTCDVPTVFIETTVGPTVPFSEPSDRSGKRAERAIATAIALGDDLAESVVLIKRLQVSGAILS